MKQLKQYNSKLPFIISDWNGNKLDHKGRYVNLNDSSERSFKDVFAWKLKGNEFKQEKKKQFTNVEVFENNDFITDTYDGFTWLGHASFFFTINNTRIIVDPVLKKIGPLKRHTSLPCDKKALLDIDIILLSHNHRDHMDKESLKLLSNNNPNAIIYTGLEIGKLLKQWGLKNKIVEAGWYQQFPEINDINISYLPSKHWCRRGLTDLNEMLWGSFMIVSKNHCLYFGADSGIDDHFSQIASLFPEIDYAFIGMGAYEPNWFMKASHTNPQEALQVIEMLKAKIFIPMHYGTFDLSDEPLNMPKETLLEVATKRQLEQTLLMDIGKKHFI